MEDNINIFDVANYIIEKLQNQQIKNKDIDISNMKIQKLIYYAHAYHLVNQKKPLVKSILEAWIYGPVFPELYQEFCKYSYHNVKKTALGKANNLAIIQKNSLDYIIKLYGEDDPGDLSERIHCEEPWLNAHNISNDWAKNVITDRNLIKYYSQKENRI